ncbi:MAG: hypothetical protein J0H79_13885 [Alphaproteobacteria bacterium]|nr:hypothetical protein [Alphaproteobacteria bacterium]
MKLVDEAKSGIPDDLKQHFPTWMVTALSIGLLVFGIGGRLVRQDKKDRPNG